MNKITLAVIAVGVLLIIGGVAIWLKSGDAVEDLLRLKGGVRTLPLKIVTWLVILP